MSGAEQVEARSIPEPNTGCWLWLGGVNRSGYGRVYVGGGSLAPKKLAHRWAMEMHSGEPVPAGMCVLHRCDVPSCVNPAHLWLGTQRDNVADRVAKGRNGAARGENSSPRRFPGSMKRPGEQNALAKLTDAEARQIKACLREGETPRALAGRFGVIARTIKRIATGFTWRHVP